jgi:hypothetical protein
MEINMPVNVVKSKEDEKKWEKAKAKASEQGHAEDWAYVMSIYQNMKGEKDKKKKMNKAAFLEGYISKQAGITFFRDKILDILPAGRRLAKKYNMPWLNKVVDVLGAGGKQKITKNVSEVVAKTDLPPDIAKRVSSLSRNDLEDLF